MDPYNEEDYKKDFDANLWKKMLFFVKPHRKTFLSILIVNLSLAALDTFFPLATKYALDNFIERADLSTVKPFVFVYVLAIIAQSLVIYNFVKLAAKLETGIIYDIRKAAFAKLQQLPFSYFDKTPVGWILARMTTDIQRIGDVIAWGVVDIFWSSALLLFVSITMFILNYQLAFALLAIFPVLAFASFYFQKKILQSQRDVKKLNSKITASFNECITSAKTTKTLVREDENAREFNTLSQSMKAVSIRSAVFSAIFLPVVLSVSSISVASVLFFGGGKVLNGAISIGTLSVFVAYAMQIFDPIQQIARIFSDIQSAQASAERTFSLIETVADISDSAEVLEQFNDKSTWPTILGDVDFENVTFAYDNGETVLENFNLHINAGEKIALVGATGAGKTTIVNLICRFYEPTGGVIKIDGVDYKQRPQAWLKSNLGYVLQSPHLFSGSILENIRFGKLDATDEEVFQAAKVVNAYDFIIKKEGGFASEVGEGGDKLSSGEKQLVSFARAIIGKPKLFVLDEATSSIDAETEQTIQKAIEEVLSNRTSFIIAHRLSTIRNCDKILVIEGGKVIESGTHEQLIALNGHYYKLYTNQHVKEEISKCMIN